MKRYLVFSGSHYYPYGGWEDFKGSFDDLGEAVALADLEKGDSGYGWANVIDTSLPYNPDLSYDWGMKVYDVRD